jgi:hypothetical protein
MSERNDGGPAFPGEYDSVVFHPEGVTEPFCIQARQSGMSLRDYFAAKAMAALAGAIASEDEHGIIHNVPSDIADISYTYADAMLAEREK